jgi:TDG/mug DNA glycosylase family protein
MSVLPDILEPGLKVVVCGTAVGKTSAKPGAYYAGLGNRFWEVLFRVGLTPRQLQSHDYRNLPMYGIGLTDLVKKASGSGDRIAFHHFDVQGFVSKIKRFAPRAIAFNGKRAAQEFYVRKKVDYGRQSDKIGKMAIFVLPSTSGAARKHWDERYWRELGDFPAES